MKTHVLSRRGVLKTLLFSTITGFNSRIDAGGILVRSDTVTWIDGCFMPHYSSISFDSARSNVLTAINTHQKVFKGVQTIFEYINDLSNGVTVEQFMLHKQSEGTLSFDAPLLTQGRFLERLNGVLHQPTQEHYWKLKINGVVSDLGISQAIINIGDKISLTLGSALNDEIVFTDSLGDYSKVLISDTIPLWNGKTQTSNDWPQERGSVWYEFCQITASEGSYFVPDQIQCTKYTEHWNAATQSWIIASTIPVSTSAHDFIGQSWNGSQETNFSQISTRMNFGGTGTGFPPLQGMTEMARISNRYAWLHSGKVRIRTVIKIPLIGPDGNSQLITSEKFSLKEEVLFPKGVQPLQVISPNETLFTAPAGQEGMLYEIENGSDLKNWNSETFVSDRPSTEIQTPVQGNQKFWRVRRF